MINKKDPNPQTSGDIIEPIEPHFNDLPENFSFTGEHIPGMGPPPAINLPLNFPEEVLQRTTSAPPPRAQSMPQQKQHMPTAQASAPPVAAAQPFSLEKREICNWAAIMHLSGLAFVTGLPFVNIIVPTILWLLKKEQHPFLEKQGREVINFQITFTLILFLCLGLGSIFIWLMPATATSLLMATKTVRVVFATSMRLPFNLFTALPFFWCCIVVIRGTVAAYNGYAYKYPGVQQFIFAGNMPPVAPANKPTAKKHATAPRVGKLSFS